MTTIRAMMTEKRLAKISSARFGFGGYQDAQFGLDLHFSGCGWGISAFVGAWARSIKVTEHTKWSEVERERQYLAAMDLLQDTLVKAKKRYIGELEGVPVEVTLKDNALDSWRVLEEVL